MQDMKRSFLDNEMTAELEDELVIHSCALTCNKFLNWVDDWLLSTVVLVTNEAAERVYSSGQVTQMFELYMVRDYLYLFLMQSSEGLLDGAGFLKMEEGDSDG